MQSTPGRSSDENDEQEQEEERVLARPPMTFTSESKPKQTTIIGERCVLIPYLAEHVPIYHSWMQQQTLLDLTASERLTLEQEYANQVSWTLDPTKVTFIILDPSLPPTPLPSTSLGQMCGDVNLFFHSYLSPLAELEIMIATPQSRRKGIASEAVHLMLDWARKYYGVHRVLVNVGGANAESLSFFKDKLGFVEKEYVHVFDEYQLLSPACRCEQCGQEGHT